MEVRAEGPRPNNINAEAVANQMMPQARIKGVFRGLATPIGDPPATKNPAAGGTASGAKSAVQFASENRAGIYSPGAGISSESSYGAVIGGPRGIAARLVGSIPRRLTRRERVAIRALLAAGFAVQVVMPDRATYERNRDRLFTQLGLTRADAP